MTRGRCTCTHSRAVHRRGIGRCQVSRCGCMFAPPPQRVAQDPPSVGRHTIDGSGAVVDYRPPTAEQRKLAAAARLSEREKLERALWMRVEAAGLPLPVLQYYWARSEGRQFRSDGAYVAERVLVEVDGGIWMPGGGGHSHPMHLETQHQRDNLAALLGWKLLRFTKRMIRSGEAVQTITRALGRRDASSQLPLIATATNVESMGV